jgi:hypothetical protein
VYSALDEFLSALVLFAIEEVSGLIEDEPRTIQHNL